jgi:hypothetical protein
MKPRSSVLGLMSVVAFLAFGLAALRAGSDAWFRTAYTLTVLILFAAAIAARYRGPFWYGFALVGWGYFVLGYWYGPETHFDHFVQLPYPTLNPSLLTSYWLNSACEAMVQKTREGASWDIRLFQLANTKGIAHSLLTLLLAVAGGIAARLFHDTRDGASP